MEKILWISLYSGKRRGVLSHGLMTMHYRNTACAVCTTLGIMFTLAHADAG